VHVKRRLRTFIKNLGSERSLSDTPNRGVERSLSDIPNYGVDYIMDDHLSGINVYLLNGGDPATSSAAQKVAQLGGTLTDTLADATHALLVSTSNGGPGSEDLSPHLEEIAIAQSLSIPVLDATRWLKRCSNLHPNEHWSEVDVAAYLPDEMVKCQLSPRRDTHSNLGLSLTQTFTFLSKEDPDLLEQNALKRAIELSLLDHALVVQTNAVSAQPQEVIQMNTPYHILGLEEGATSSQIKSAYRSLAKQTHPDKGGSADDFAQISRAYRSLVAMRDNSCAVTEKDSLHIKSTSHWDSELKDHRRLVEELFASHSANLDQTIAAQKQVLKLLGLVHQDAGSTNVNEQEEVIHNSCFYLSLAASYLSGVEALLDGHDNLKDEENVFLIRETALQLKRLIEAAVVTAHPEWAASGWVGEEVQAFSDFLVYLLDSSDTLISDWAVVVFDTTSGVCDVYKGKYYDARPEWKQSSTITIQYLPGHYQPLLPINGDKRASLDEILTALDKNEVFYVVTDGAA